jgi:hypothetical protein
MWTVTEFPERAKKAPPAKDHLGEDNDRFSPLTKNGGRCIRRRNPDMSSFPVVPRRNGARPSRGPHRSRSPGTRLEPALQWGRAL